MNEREIADWEREIKHAQKMQEQRKSKREGWELKNQPKVYVASLRLDWTWPTSHSEQFNEE